MWLQMLLLLSWFPRSGLSLSNKSFTRTAPVDSPNKEAKFQEGEQMFSEALLAQDSSNPLSCDYHRRNCATYLCVLKLLKIRNGQLMSIH